VVYRLEGLGRGVTFLKRAFICGHRQPLWSTLARQSRSDIVHAEGAQSTEPGSRTITVVASGVLLTAGTISWTVHVTSGSVQTSSSVLILYVVASVVVIALSQVTTITGGSEVSDAVTVPEPAGFAVTIDQPA